MWTTNVSPVLATMSPLADISMPELSMATWPRGSVSTAKISPAEAATARCTSSRSGMRRLSHPGRLWARGHHGTSAAPARPRVLGRDHDLAGNPGADGADGLAGGVGGGADWDDLVQGGGVEGLPVRGGRDVEGGSDADRLAGRVGSGADRRDRARGPFGVGGVEGLPVRGDHHLQHGADGADGLADLVSHGADRGDRELAANVEGLPVRGDGQSARGTADEDRLTRRIRGGADRRDRV